VPAIPGLTGDSASARWPAMVDTISSAATAPNTRNERRAIPEIVNIGIIPLVADSKARPAAPGVGAFNATFSTCAVS
jgi:hypothetical protein